MKTFSCKLITPEKVLFEESVWQVSIKNRNNNFAMRAGHADLLFTAESAVLEIASTESSRQKWNISDSILEFSKNSCSIMCRTVEVV